MSKDQSVSAYFLRGWSRECFIEVYVDNQCKMVIVYDYTDSDSDTGSLI